METTSGDKKLTLAEAMEGAELGGPIPAAIIAAGPDAVNSFLVGAAADLLGDLVKEQDNASLMAIDRGIARSWLAVYARMRAYYISRRS